jgi:hypothetical protein
MLNIHRAFMEDVFSMRRYNMQQNHDHAKHSVSKRFVELNVIFDLWRYELKNRRLMFMNTRELRAWQPKRWWKPWS